MFIRNIICITLLYILLSPVSAFASSTDSFATKTDLDYVWTLCAAALVLFMQLGFMLIEAGMTRSKNSINIAHKNFSDFLISVFLFYLIGFSLMFSYTLGGFIGTPIFELKTNWHFAFFVFQAVYVGTAATIVSGAVAERMSFGSYIILVAFISIIIYPIVGHWVWGNTLITENTVWLANKGFLDSAGSTVVHSVGAWVALAGIIVLGPRIGKFNEDGTANEIHGHNMVLTTAGALILLFGWFGFNGGAAASGNEDISRVIGNTLMAGVSGGIAGFILGIYFDKLYKPIRSINGMLGGLVAITAGCFVVSPNSAVVIGFLAGMIVNFSDQFIEKKLKLDDVVGAVSVHGICGVFGTISVAFFAESDKLLAPSRFAQFLVQCEGVLIIFVWTFGLSYLLLKIVDRFIGIRVSAEHELIGLNTTEHGASLGNHDIQQELLKIAKGEADLSTRLNENSGDEAAELAQLINPFLDKFQTLVGNVAHTSEQLSNDLTLISNAVNNSAGSLKENTTSVENSSLISHKSANAAADRVLELNNETGRIAKSAKDVSEDMRTLADTIKGLSASIDSINNSAESTNNVSQEAAKLADEAHNTINNLSNAANKIEEVVALIDDIQNKTKLLALNATIEAERAGEYGKGFAVVAHEVKSLSQNAAGATDEIRKSLEKMRGASGNAAELLSKVSETLSIINTSVEGIRTTATQESNSVSQISEDVAASANQVVNVSQNIAQLSDDAISCSEHVREAAGHSENSIKTVSNLRDEVANSLQTAKMVEMSSTKLTGLAKQLSDTSGQVDVNKSEQEENSDTENETDDALLF